MGFPKGFLFGTANADHQVEAHDPEREDVWDLWERYQGLKQRGRATDFWNRYEEDIAAAAGLGCSITRSLGFRIDFGGGGDGDADCSLRGADPAI